MIIKTDVTPEEKILIQSLAKAEGKSVSAYLKSKALSESKDSTEQLMQCIEIQSSIAQSINKIATTVIRNKVIYEAEILELLARMSELEKANAEALKEVRKHGNPRKQKHKGDTSLGSKV